MPLDEHLLPSAPQRPVDMFLNLQGRHTAIHNIDSPVYGKTDNPLGLPSAYAGNAFRTKPYDACLNLCFSDTSIFQ
jgi:hypothetical protein